VIVEAKPVNDSYTPNLLSKAAFQEMIDFEEMLFTGPWNYEDTKLNIDGIVTDMPMQGRKLYFPDFC
jgi:hypothetical protein